MTVRQILAAPHGRMGYMFGARRMMDNPPDSPLAVYAVANAAWREAEASGLDYDGRYEYTEGAKRGAIDVKTRNRVAAARARLAKYA